MDEGNGILFKASFRCVLIELQRPGVTAWPLLTAGISRGERTRSNDARTWYMETSISPLGTELRRKKQSHAIRMSRQGRRFESCRSNSPVDGDSPICYSYTRIPRRDAGNFCVQK